MAGSVNKKKTGKKKPSLGKDDFLEKMDPAFKVLVEKGKRKGFITYEEMNNVFPEDIENIDNVLLFLDDLGIELVDETEVPEAERKGGGETEEEEQFEKSAHT
jgi:RNA polymerase primary sigma factor